MRVTEKTPLEETILEIDVYPRHNLTIQPVDRIEDASYFGLKNINNTTIGVVLLRPLDELVDNDNPQNVLKFRIVCDYGVGMETVRKLTLKLNQGKTCQTVTRVTDIQTLLKSKY